MTIQEQLDAAVRAWVPRFEPVTSLTRCTDQINRPHEDYPQRVERTADLIRHLTQGKYYSVLAGDCLQLHKQLMADKPWLAGQWRTITVALAGSGYVPPAPLFVPELITACFPFSPRTEADLRSFYARFQCIHPFNDGNGRVGGILVAALSKLLFGYYLTPCQ